MRLLVVCVLLVGATLAAKIPTCLDDSIKSFPYCDKSLTPEQRMADLLPRMTQQEKLKMVHGVGIYPYIGEVKGNARLGIPGVHLEDGPQGVADLATKVTCFPSALAVTSTWDRAMFAKFGEAMATEQRAKGTTVLLGPMSNIARIPRGGRNFESAGEEPFLASEFSVGVIKAIQSKGIIACAKHFVANNQETNRGSVSAEIDERILWEMYYPHFQASVEAGVGSVMCSYNLINGTHGCQNKKTLSDLRDRMGFKGFVVSDWFATHARADSANAGLDMEMPFGLFLGSLGKAIEEGEVPQSRLDEMVSRILTPHIAAGIFDREVEGTIHSEARTPETRAAALDLARASAVLLKNDNMLPFEGIKTIAVIGPDSDSAKFVKDSGSGGVWAEKVITVLEGIKARAGKDITVTHYTGKDVEKAAKEASKADVAIVAAGVHSAEGKDRSSLSLSDINNEIITAVAAKQQNTIVVIQSGGAVTMPWIDEVRAVVFQVTPGQDAGTALAEVLWGDINPSGHLALSFPVSEDSTWLLSEDQFPGIKKVEHYTEGLFLGYRWYDAQGTKPLFPFGHGLSYTTFNYSGISASSNEVSVTVTNSGRRAGAAVVQLYVSFPEEANEPPKLLRGFEKVQLEAGQSAKVKFTLREKDLSIYDPEVAGWVPVHGKYVAHVASSAAEIHLSTTFKF